MKYFIVCVTLLVGGLTASSQQSVEQYKLNKEKRLKEKSPFEKIIDREQYATVVYENEHVIAFSTIKDQAPVHYLIVPKKRIATVNDITEKDVVALGHLFLAAKEVAKKFGVAESGFRLSVNTNQDAGQSVFHLHMHLLGGSNVGAMTTTEYTINKESITLPAATLAQYAGRYQLPAPDPSKANAFIMTIIVEGDQLFSQLPGQPKSEVFAQTETRFFSKAVSSEVEFVKNASGIIDHLIFYQGGQQIKGVKVN